LTESLKVRPPSTELKKILGDALRREDELRRLQRILRARGRSGQAILRAKDELDCLEQACRIVVEDCGHAMVWIGYAGQDAGKNVRPVARAGFEEGYLETLKITWADTERGRGPVGTAFRSGKPSVCRDMLTDPRFKPWRAQAVKRGYASSISLPLRGDDGKTFGVVSIYSKEPDAFTAQEVELLTGLADDLGYGIAALRMREARRLAEARFQQAQKMEAVGLLAGGIAHDFNNTLAVLTGYNHLLLDGLESGHPLRGHCLEMRESLKVGAALAQQLLGISGNRSPQTRILDPNSVILQMTKLLRRLLSRNIRLEKKLQRSVWPVRMGSGQLEQIVLNLAVNSRDAMPRGGRLSLKTRNVILGGDGSATAEVPAAPGRYVVLEVGDTGAGMEAAVKARLFEPFFTTKGPGRGTGLGLSSVRSIVKEHKGYISFESRPGEGTVFRVYLPSVKGGAKAMVSKGAAETKARGGETVLVVEDNDCLLNLVTMTLQRAGYSVLSGRTAERALALCADRAKPLDLLLTDVVLPDLDGPELAKKVKGLRPGIRTVYMSGYPGNSLNPIAGFGRAVLLEKPFSPEHLLSTLRRVLSDGQGDLF
jgi:signal transduction histidine kinase/CheY-like chemotaxis protein